MAGCLLGVAGCGDGAPGPVAVSTPVPTGSAAAGCSALVGAVPDRVAGRTAREVSPSAAPAAAWGDPPVVLVCGVPRPAALVPTSQCFRVNGVDWLLTQQGRAVDPAGPLHGTLDFTTVGRSPYVRVSVPDDVQPAADALVDLAPAIRQHTEVLRPCQ